jgi:hypothetical protein
MDQKKEKEKKFDQIKCPMCAGGDVRDVELNGLE